VVAVEPADEEVGSGAIPGARRPLAVKKIRGDRHLLWQPHRFIGRSAHQVDEFLAEVMRPILAAAGAGGAPREEVRV